MLDEFWASHEPFFPPHTRQYASIIFAATEEEHRIAAASKARVERESGLLVCTEIRDSGDFHPAENYHQKYFLRRRPELMLKFRALFPDEESFAESAVAMLANAALGGDLSGGRLAAALDRPDLSAEEKLSIARLASEIE